MESGIITAVHQDTKNKHRYHIFINNQPAFFVHEEILLRYKLFKGTEIESAFYAEIIAAEERNRAYLLALRYVGIRPRTAYQLEKYLHEKGFSPELCRETRQRCKEKGYIDDAAFARQWVQERMRLKAKSSYVLRMELLQRGIAGELIDAAIGMVSTHDELEAARRLTAKKTKHGALSIDLDEERKLCMMLQRKGFSHGIIQQIRREIRENRE